MADASAAPPHGPPQSSPPTHTVEVRVLEPGNDCNVYTWDADLGAPQLERVVRPSAPRGADLARLPLLSGFTVRAAARQGPDAPRRKFRFGELTERTSAAEQLPSGEPLSGQEPGPSLEGPGLLVLLLADPSNPSGAWVRARVLGAWRPSEEQHTPSEKPATTRSDATIQPAEGGELDALMNWTLIAVPDVDAALARVTDVTVLPPAVRTRLAQALRSVVARSSREEMPRGEWLDAAGAFDLCQRARLLARRTRGATGTEATATGGRGAPRRQDQDEEANARVAWRVLAGVSATELRALGPGAYSEAEHLLRFIPARFGRYLGNLLWPDERVLFFAERPAIGPRSGGIRTLLPARQSARLQAGLLLLTTQQVLCLRDYAPPDATLVEWGYLARAYPLGRVVGATILPPGATLTDLDVASLPGLPGMSEDRLAAIRTAFQAADPETRRELGAERLARLLLVVEAHGGIEVAGMAMPDGARGGLEWTAAFLRSCAPHLGEEAAHDRRVRPLPVVEPWRPAAEEAAALEGLGGEIAPALRIALDTALAEALEPGEEWVVTARAADLSVTGGGQVAAHTLGVTARRLMLISAHLNPRGLPSRRERRADQPPPHIVVTGTIRALGDLTSATLQQSLLGCALWTTHPQAAAPTDHGATHVKPEIAIGFASPASAPFQALFVRLRTLLSGPLVP